MIQVEGLTKYYGGHAAIKDLAFNIERGEVIGFLGLNGAGKTTTLKVLGCVLLPTSGRVLIDGFDVMKDPHEIRKRIGFLPDTPPLYDEMTVGRYLSFVAQLRGVAPADAPRYVKEVEDITALREVDDTPIEALSHGYKQRVGLAQAMVHKPKLLILDEPTGGLDPVQIVEMRELIRKLRGQHTVLVSSHILSEISQICDRLLVIQAGEIVAQGTEAELAARFGGGGTVDVELRSAPSDALVAAVKAIAGVSKVTVTGATLLVAASPELRPQIARAVLGNGGELLRLDKGAERLESIFVKLTRGPGGANA